ncbi:MAG: endo alpha-1,4 polygalactosaminidase [Chlamydiia bacterium]|nr:endo alpha-1,4 polygalactosaminidase [Chlamydiia bacterium]
MISSLFASKPYVVYYSDKAPVSAFEPYSLLILDSDYHPPLQALKERGKKLIGYINVGEVENTRRWYKNVKQEGLLLHENKNWPGSFYMDLRDNRWTARVVEELVPALLQKGFDGVFLDTLDNAEMLEKKYPGMMAAAERLVKALRIHFPEMPIVMNRGYFLLPKVGKMIDYLMAEDVLSLWDAQEKKYVRLPDSIVQETVRFLQEAKKTYPELEILSLDYWYPDQKEVIREIYQKERKFGFNPYVATWNLDSIIPEPK